jgi:murein DD-endopeptidase MepM/ murein hydrolase activator NlpD
MKKSRFYLILVILLTLSCTTAKVFEAPPPIGKRYGQPDIHYGEKIHPGIDFDIPIGTPIITVSDGTVERITNPLLDDHGDRYGQGFFVLVTHGDYFYSLYGYLAKTFVRPGQFIRRGDLIGLSGPGQGRYEHLHFGIVKIGGYGNRYSHTYDPNDYWLDGEQKCFDPRKDYSKYSAKEITAPVACGEYAKTVSIKLRKAQ